MLPVLAAIERGPAGPVLDIIVNTEKLSMMCVVKCEQASSWTCVDIWRSGDQGQATWFRHARSCPLAIARCTNNLIGCTLNIEAFELEPIDSRMRM